MTTLSRTDTYYVFIPACGNALNCFPHWIVNSLRAGAVLFISRPGIQQMFSRYMVNVSLFCALYTEEPWHQSWCCLLKEGTLFYLLLCSQGLFVQRLEHSVEYKFVDWVKEGKELFSELETFSSNLDWLLTGNLRGYGYFCSVWHQEFLSLFLFQQSHLKAQTLHLTLLFPLFHRWKKTTVRCN